MNVSSCSDPPRSVGARRRGDGVERASRFAYRLNGEDAGGPRGRPEGNAPSGVKRLTGAGTIVVVVLSAGAVGLRGYLPGAATQAPVTISFHDFLLTGTAG